MTSQNDAFLAPLMDLYLHQNELLWSRAQTLFAIQTATIAGAFTAPRAYEYFSLVVWLGIAVTIALIPIMARDIAVRDCNKAIIERLGRSSDPAFVLNPPPPTYFPFKGDHIVFAITLLLLAVDVALLAIVPRP